jgi:ABC-type branched-subunit amino acid transport system ATPase component
MSELLLSAHNLSVRFGGVLAVNKVSFDVRRGEVFTLIGPNGAGKTTVFNLISRIYTPTSGHIDFKGKDATEVTYPKAPAAAFQQYATSAAILIDKFRLEGGEVTERTEAITTDTDLPL